MQLRTAVVAVVVVVLAGCAPDNIAGAPDMTPGAAKAAAAAKAAKASSAGTGSAAPAAPVVAPAPTPKRPRIPEHPSTSLRIRVARGAAVKDPAYKYVSTATAQCRADEQLTGGNCTDGKTVGGPVDADGKATRYGDEDTTFGGGWTCTDTNDSDALAYCLSDPSNVPAEKPETAATGSGSGSGSGSAK